MFRWLQLPQFLPGTFQTFFWVVSVGCFTSPAILSQISDYDFSILDFDPCS